MPNTRIDVPETARFGMSLNDSGELSTSHNLEEQRSSNICPYTEKDRNSNEHVKIVDAHIRMVFNKIFKDNGYVIDEERSRSKDGCVIFKHLTNRTSTSSIALYNSRRDIKLELWFDRDHHYLVCVLPVASFFNDSNLIFLNSIKI